MPNHLRELGWLSAIALIAALRCPAQVINPDPNYYDFHPRSIMSIGLGFSPNDVSAAKIRCIEYTAESLEPGALTTQFFYTLVTNSEQLKSTLSLDSKVDASFLLFSGSATYDLKESSAIASDSITVVISARSEFPRLSMKAGAHLTPEAMALLSDSLQFEKTCGSRVVQIEHRGASVSAIVTVFGLTTDQKTNVTSGLSVHGGWGPLTAAASVAFQKELSEASKQSRVGIQVVATGGNGFSTLSGLVTATTGQPDALHAIQAVLANYVQQFTKDNAVPIGFDVVSMESFGWRPTDRTLTHSWTLSKERKLRLLAQRAREISDQEQAAKGILAGIDPRRIEFTSATLSELRAALTVWDDYMSDLSAAHTACKQTRSPDDQPCEIPTRSLPRADLIPPLPDPPTIVLDSKEIKPINALPPGMEVVAKGRLAFDLRYVDYMKYGVACCPEGLRNDVPLSSARPATDAELNLLSITRPVSRVVPLAEDVKFGFGAFFAASVGGHEMIYVETKDKFGRIFHSTLFSGQ
jgi:hypothetical protein